MSSDNQEFAMPSIRAQLKHLWGGAPWSKWRRRYLNRIRSMPLRPAPLSTEIPVLIQATRKHSLDSEIGSRGIMISGRRGAPTRVDFRQADKDLRVNIVCYQKDSWILRRISEKLSIHLSQLGVENCISDEPLDGYSVHHHIPYTLTPSTLRAPVNTVLVTHIDSKSKLAKSRNLVRAGFHLIAMSKQTAEMIRPWPISGAGGADHVRTFLLPSLIERKPRIKIGVFFRTYSDGRKREKTLLEICKKLGGENLIFMIMGSGWSVIVNHLRALGAEVRHTSEFERRKYLDWIDRCDFVLLLGRDEGAVAFLDGLASGKRVIAPAVGYHLDYLHPNIVLASNSEEIAAALRPEIELATRAYGLVGNAQWPLYANAHLALWQEIWRTNSEVSAKNN